MNIARLRRLISESDLSLDTLRYLFSCRCECEFLDYKQSLFLGNEKEICGFAKDALAFKNMGGGYIVVGVEDKTWKLKGHNPELTAYDSKMLIDKVRKASGLTLNINMVIHQLENEGQRLSFSLILIRGSQKGSKRKSPSLVSHDYLPKEAFGLRRGDIYARRTDSTIKISSDQELEDLLDNLEIQSNEESVAPAKEQSQFAIQDGLYRLLDHGYEEFIGRTDLRNAVESAVCGDPRIWIVNAHGPGGVGKSALVNWVTGKIYKDRVFEAILQLTAKETILTENGIRGYSKSLYSLENLLDQLLLLFEETPDRDLEKNRELALALLDAYKTLIVLDNMETVSDGRIVDFIQTLPPGTKARVLLTSRTKTGGWERSIPVTEMTTEEVSDFIRIRSMELKVDFPLDPDTIQKVAKSSGGLPLAIQWILGQYKKSRRLDFAIEAANRSDSPVLEFSFRNIWSQLSSEARTVLAVMSIFDEPPSIQQIATALETQQDFVERALSDLEDVTLVNRIPGTSGHPPTFSALPITLSFSRHQLAKMGDLEARSRQRTSRFNEQLELQNSETARFRGAFEKYGIKNPAEKRAVILCRQAESEAFRGNADGADALFDRARDLAPHNSYVLANIALNNLRRRNAGTALQVANEACRRATKQTGAFCYEVKAQIFDELRRKQERVSALETAVGYDPNDLYLRHQLGVALSRVGKENLAIDQFSQIIQIEEQRTTPTESLVMALDSRALNYRRRGSLDEEKVDLDRIHRLISEYPNLGYLRKRPSSSQLQA